MKTETTNRLELIKNHLKVGNSIKKSTSELMEEYRIQDFLEAIADDPIAMTQLTIQIQGMLQKHLNNSH
jgi:hypothetical protein